MRSRHQILCTSAAILFSLWLFSITRLDFLVQEVLYQNLTHHWLWSGHEPIKHFLFYNFIKDLLALFALVLLIVLVGDRQHKLNPQRRTGMLIVLLSLLLAPATVLLLKWNTDVACPRALVDFGGSLPYHSLINHLTSAIHYPQLQRCFPAGHASGGFALMSLVFLFDSPRGRRMAMAFALAIGWTMGFYKMAIGDHFLSHTVIAMLVDWLIINLIALCCYQWLSYRNNTRAAPSIFHPPSGIN